MSDGVKMPVFIPPCRNCGQPIDSHHLADFADDRPIGARFRVCPRATYQPPSAEDEAYGLLRRLVNAWDDDMELYDAVEACRDYLVRNKP